MKARLALTLAMSLTLTMGCQTKLPTGAATGKAKPKATATATPGAAAIVRVIDARNLTENAPVKLSGLARIISDNGLGIISNNGGGIISNNSGGIISDNGLGYRALATGAKPESYLADAKIEVLDAQGRVLVDAAKKPLAATTDKQGRFSLNGVLPRENLVLRIKLWNGGQLTAMLPKGEGEAMAIDLNTASTLSAVYVLEQYVKQRQGILNLLPRTESDSLNKEMEAARGLLAGTPTYKAKDMIKATEDLRRQAKGVDEALTRIEAILLAGQKDLGNGLPANQVPLAGPNGIVGDGQGNLYLIESATRRLRKVDTKGIITQLALKGELLGNVTGMARAADGTIYAASPAQHKVNKIAPDGTVTLFAGTGLKGQGEMEVQATTSPLDYPCTVAVGPDGTVYIAEVANHDPERARLLSVDKAGLIHLVPTEEPMWLGTGDSPSDEPVPAGLAVAADGTLYAGIRYTGALARRTAAGGWEKVGALLPMDYAGIVVAPDGTIYASSTEAHTVIAFAPDGTQRVIAGQDKQPGSSGDGGPADKAMLNEPSGLWLAPDGTLYVVDSGNRLVRAVAKDGTIRTIAGTLGLSEQGELNGLALNGPAGLAIDAKGRLVVAEAATATIKRLDGKTLTVIAGSIKGEKGASFGDGGQALKARFNGPGQIAIHQDHLYILDNADNRLRHVAPDGVVSTLAGGTVNQTTYPRRFKADSDFLVLPTGLAVSPEGIPYFADARNQHVYKLVGGEAEIVVGSLDRKEGFSGDGGPAIDALLNSPSALAFDAAGNLFVADTANLAVRKIAKDGTITTIAGLGLEQSLGKLFSYKAGSDEGAKATESLFILPVSLCFDAAGNLYVGEGGTANVDLAGDRLPLPAALVPKIGARVRKIAPDGTISTVVGAGGKALKDGELSAPIGILVDPQGRMIISDAAANQVWMLPKGSY